MRNFGGSQFLRRGTPKNSARYALASPGRAGKYTEVLGNDKSNQNFRFFGSSKNAVFFENFSSHDSMTPKLVHTQLWRYAFVWPYGTTNRKPHAKKKHGKNTVGPNDLTDFKQFELKHPPQIKTILAMTSFNHPGEGITLRQNRSTSHIPSIWDTRARSERPPAGPEKYTEVLGNDISKQ